MFKGIFSEDFPVAFTVFILQQTYPRFRLGAPRKGILKRSIRIFENKFDVITGALTIPKRFRKPTTENVNPVRNVPLACIVVSNKDHRLVSGWGIDVFHMDKEELMVQHPFSFDYVCRGTSTNLSR